MSRRFNPAAVVLFAMLAVLGCVGGAGASSVVGLLPFQDTGASPPSHYGNGSNPYAELVQASDGNFYGTTETGGTGLCLATYNPHPIVGCGTVFQINGKTGTETVIYSFPRDPATNTAPNGAYPTAGLIQGQDGALYGVAQDGGIPGCSGQYGCGTLFRISPPHGTFTLLHQFCGGVGCAGITKGGRPMNHLVQAADGMLYGVTAFYDPGSGGTLFSATTSGALATLHIFVGGNDGYEPSGALLIGHDGKTLYGVTESGGGGGVDAGTVFSYAAGTLRILYFFNPEVLSEPVGALIYGADGKLYGVTDRNSQSFSGGEVFSLNPDGSAFTDETGLVGYPEAGLLLGSDGQMYGTLSALAIPPGPNYGGVFVYNPVYHSAGLLIGFGIQTGSSPRGALIEGKDHRLFGSNFNGGGSNGLGPDEGTLFRIGPPLP